MAGFEANRGSSRASAVVTTSRVATTVLQNECESGVERVSGSPDCPGKTCSSTSTSETSATGTPSSRAASRASRSSAGSPSTVFSPSVRRTRPTVLPTSSRAENSVTRPTVPMWAGTLLP